MTNTKDQLIPADAVSYFERLNYFFGKLLTVRDFQTEQNYLNEKRWMLNRFAGGWGVVCGMKVAAQELSQPQVMVGPGLALDRYGHEIFIGAPQAVALAQSLPQAKTEYWVYVRYKEHCAEPAPAPSYRCDAVGPECHYSRIHETFELFATTNAPDSAAKIDCDTLMTPSCCKGINAFRHRHPDRSGVCLAKVTIFEQRIIQVDNCGPRRWLWSNEILGRNLEENIRRANSSRMDRLPFVPLLAQTIKGLKYQDGRNLIITKLFNAERVGEIKQEIGNRPCGIATDGEWIWLTDQGKDDQTNPQAGVLKINQAATEVHKLQVSEKSWGIAFDGHYMWVTHPKAHKVSKIPTMATNEVPVQIDIRSDPSNPNDKPEPKDIIFANGFLWIARNNGITRIDVVTDEVQWHTFGETPIAMAFDGTYIWFVCTTSVDAPGKVGRIALNGATVPIVPEIRLNRNPEAIVFDGTSMWITHFDGVTKIDVSKDKDEGTVCENKTLTGAAFDGIYLWLAEPAAKAIHRLDIHDTKRLATHRPVEREGTPLHGERHFSKMCFDGKYVWVTDYQSPSSGSSGDNVGVLHRILI